MFSGIVFRLRNLIRRRAVDADLDQELRAHVDNEIEKYIRAGLSRQEAIRRAQLAFGGIGQVQEECREESGASFFDTTIQDLRYGLRMLRRNPGVTMTAVITLMLGIGATTAVFSVVNTVLLKALPYPDSGKIVTAWRVIPVGSVTGSDDLPWNPREFRALLQASSAFESLGAVGPFGFFTRLERPGGDWPIEARRYDSTSERRDERLRPTPHRPNPTRARHLFAHRPAFTTSPRRNQASAAANPWGRQHRAADRLFECSRAASHSVVEPQTGIRVAQCPRGGTVSANAPTANRESVGSDGWRRLGDRTGGSLYSLSQGCGTFEHSTPSGSRP
jgi:hypothetical protein